MDRLMSRFRRVLVEGLNRRGIVGDDMRLNRRGFGYDVHLSRRGVVGDEMRCPLCIYKSLSLGIQIGWLPYRRLWERL